MPIGYEGIGLITPAYQHRNMGGPEHSTKRCWYPKAISLITEQPLREEKGDKPLTAKQKKKIEGGRRFGTYMVYNTSQEAMILPKNLTVGWCQLVLQPNQDTYVQELAAMQQERCAEQQEEVNHHHLAAMKPEGRRKVRKEQADWGLEEKLSKDWVLDNFQL